LQSKTFLQNWKKILLENEEVAMKPAKVVGKITLENQ